MKHFYKLFFISIIFSPVFSFAQSNYRPGYVINLKGDTVKGFIDYREWDRNPHEIDFKNKLNDTVKTFSIANSNGFAVTGLEYYQRANVIISTDALELTKLSVRIDTSYTTGAVFLRVLASGKNVTLYNYIDGLKVRYYIKDNTNNTIEELEYHLHLNAENIENVVQVNKFRIQLENLAQKFDKNTPAVEKQIEYSTYEGDDISAIVSAINGSGSKQFKTVSLLGYRFFAGAAIISNKIYFEGDLNIPAGTKIFPKLTGGFDILPNKNTQALTFRFELSLTGDQRTWHDNGDFVLHVAAKDFKYSVITTALSPQIMYNIYNTNKLKVFADLCGNINVSFYSHHATTYNYNDISTSVEDSYPAFQTMWITFPLKAGVILNKKIEIYAAYIPASTITENYVHLAGVESSYEAGVNYLFSIK